MNRTINNRGSRPQLSREAHPNWLGDAVSYGGIHARVIYQRGPARLLPCADGCGSMAKDWSYTKGCPDEALHLNRRGFLVPYCPHVEHYQPRCRACHTRYDKANHCTHGHEYTASNTYRCPRTGHRQCRICRRERDRERQARRRVRKDAA